MLAQFGLPPILGTECSDGADRGAATDRRARRNSGLGSGSATAVWTAAQRALLRRLSICDRLNLACVAAGPPQRPDPTLPRYAERRHPIACGGIAERGDVQSSGRKAAPASSMTLHRGRALAISNAVRAVTRRALARRLSAADPLTRALIASHAAVVRAEPAASPDRKALNAMRSCLRGLSLDKTTCCSHFAPGRVVSRTHPARRVGGVMHAHCPVRSSPESRGCALSRRGSGAAGRTQHPPGGGGSRVDFGGGALPAARSRRITRRMRRRRPAASVTMRSLRRDRRQQRPNELHRYCWRVCSRQAGAFRPAQSGSWQARRLAFAR